LIRRPALVFIFIFSTLILCFWLNVVDRATTEQKTTGNRIQNLTSRLSCSLPGKLMINGVHPTFSKSLMVSVAVSKLGCSGLVLVDSGMNINGSYYSDLDLDNNCQSPDGYFGNGVCTPTGMM